MKLLKRLSFAAFALFSLMFFAACSDVKNPFDGTGDSGSNDNNDDELPTGVYTVADAIKAYNKGGAAGVTVEGFIVGVYDFYTSVYSFDAETIVAANILLADAADENDATNCLIVQLPTETEARDSLNLKSNPENYKRKVKITGDVEAYYSVAGLKSLTAYELGEAVSGGVTVVIPEEVQSIASAIANGAGGAKVQGTVIASNTCSALISDESGAILVYLGEGKGVDYSAGDVLLVAGGIKKYAGMLQFGEDASVEKVGTAEVTHPVPEVMSGETMDAALASPAIKYVEFTGVYSLSNGKYHNVAVEGAVTAIGSIQYPAENLFTANSGDVIKVTGYSVGVDYNKYYYTIAVKVEVVESAGNSGDSGDNGSEEEGDEEDSNVDVSGAMSVEKALAYYSDGDKKTATVIGYIVGSVNGTSNPKKNAEFKADVTKDTNLLLADSPDETDADKCLVVQLSTNVRAGLKVADNYKKLVSITGSIEKYFGVAGLKSPTEYKYK